jgi:DNA polymerase-3 subunit gamma/tau
LTIFTTINEIADLSADFNDVLSQIIQVLHRVAFAQQMPGLIEQDFDADMLAGLAGLLSPEDVQLFYQIALLGQKDLDLAPDPRSGFEMVILRMLAFKPSVSETIAVNPIAKPIVAKNHFITLSPSQSSYPPPERKPENPVLEVSTISDVEPISGHSANTWPDMITAMRLGGMTRELANNCVLERLDDKACTLRLDPGHLQLRGAVAEEKLQKAVQIYSGKPIKLVINTEKISVDTPAKQLHREREDRQQAAVDAINSDENVLALKEQFDARILSGSIEPI